MNPLNWRAFLDRAGLESPSAGDELAAEFSELISAYYLESSRWRLDRGAEIRETALTLWAVRDDVRSGEMTIDDGRIWADAGRRILDDIRHERNDRRRDAYPRRNQR